MKTIKKISFKSAETLSKDELKQVFGGSSVTPAELIKKVCTIGAPCTFKHMSGATLAGLCIGDFVSGRVGCYCSSSGGTLTSEEVNGCFNVE